MTYSPSHIPQTQVCPAKKGVMKGSLRLPLWYTRRVFLSLGQPAFLFCPTPEHSLDMSVKTEGSSLAKACTFQDQIKSLASDPAQSAGELVKRQEVTPMVSSNTPSTALFKVGEIYRLCLSQDP